MIDFSTKQVLTFDCYGTLIDWETGLTAALQPLLRKYQVDLPDEQALEVYGELETEVERGPYLAYRDVLAEVLARLGQRYGFKPTGAETAAFAASVGDWPAFPDSPAALVALHRCFKLVIISNVDDDLFALS